MADVLLDACCLINLCSSGRILDIFRDLPNRWHICTAVAAETLFVEEWVENNRTRSLVNLMPWFERGITHRCQADTADELAAYVNYAALVDDGEAMCLALAKCRSWTLATDERKGRRIASKDGIVTRTTPEIVKSWAEQTAAPAKEVRAIIKNIEDLGHYHPASDLPGGEWWRRAAVR